MTRKTVRALAAEIRELLALLPEHASELSPIQTRRLREELDAAAQELRTHMSALDPTKQPDSFFDPSDPTLFGIFAAIALIGQDRLPLASVERSRFYGSGVYALYYKGSFPLYAPLSGTENPIYVGKAVPSRTDARNPKEQGDKLCSRLNEHRKNIARATKTLRIEDFECRYLVVQSGWQEAAENALIGLFRPIWNKESRILFGFGKHGDSFETRSNKRSPWDVLHPARVWAEGEEQEDARTPEQIATDVNKHLAMYPPVTDLQAVLHSLVQQMKHDG